MSLFIKHLNLQSFRNHESFELNDVEKLTIIVGPNAVGKTNIIEGIQLLTALTSFRNPTIEQLVNEKEKSARLGIDLSDDNRLLSLELKIIEGRKNYLLNGKLKKPADIKGIIPSVTFTPEDLDLTKSSSTPRRILLDTLGSQLSANHYVIKKDYEKVVKYKNRLLKEEADNSLIDSINDMLLTCGTQLLCYRIALFDKILPIIQKYYRKITHSEEEFYAEYILSWELKNKNFAPRCVINKTEIRRIFEESLQNVYNEEKRAKRALIGPHLDHIELFINNRNVSAYGSQGQRRSIVLAIKLAEVSLIQSILQQKPVLLLDDVMSELDIERRQALISFIEGDIQTFITTTNLNYFNDELLQRAKIVTLPFENDDEAIGTEFEKGRNL